MQAALDNFWNFIQMSDSDPGWSNSNGDVTDLRSLLLPVCGLWIICGPVGPRSSDLFVKEFEKKGAVSQLILHFLRESVHCKGGRNAPFQHLCFEEHLKVLWLTEAGYTWRKSLFGMSACEIIGSQCMTQVVDSFWSQDVFVLTPANAFNCNVWAVIITEHERVSNSLFSLNVILRPLPWMLQILEQ